jgi:triacylglycerol lipase
MTASSALPPIVLVHGIFDRPHVFAALRARLEADGRDVHAFALRARWGGLGIDAMAHGLRDDVAGAIGERPVDVVGFSMGGLVTRFWAQRLDALERIRRMVLIASPHAGTRTAHVWPGPAARQMCPGSPFLADLNADVHRLRSARVASVWTPYDLMIVPASSAALPVGEVAQVRTKTHAGLLRDPAVAERVRRWLADPLPA